MSLKSWSRTLCNKDVAEGLSFVTRVNKTRLLFNTSLEGLLEYSIHKALLALQKKAGLLDDAEISLWEASHSRLL